MSDAVRALESALRSSFGGALRRDASLAPLTTYRLGGPAALLAEPGGREDLSALVEALRAHPVEILVLGRGSNLVVSDHGWPGVVVRLGEGFAGVGAASEPGIVDVGASRPLPLVANWAARRALAGLEWAVGVPGSVGGAVCMNAGAHGGDMSDVVRSASVVDLTGLSIETWDASDLGYSYRRSNVTRRHLVLGARLAMGNDEPAAIRTRMEEYRKHRAATQPGALQNAGSTFKNPTGDSAGRLVEAAGLKGFAIGAASVSRIHANFFMAGDGATSQDVFDLVHEVRERVRAASGTVLEPEVRFVGEFRRSAPSGLSNGGVGKNE